AQLLAGLVAEDGTAGLCILLNDVPALTPGVGNDSFRHCTFLCGSMVCGDVATCLPERACQPRTCFQGSRLAHAVHVFSTYCPHQWAEGRREASRLSPAWRPGCLALTQRGGCSSNITPDAVTDHGWTGQP